MKIKVVYNQDIELPGWLLDRFEGDSLMAKIILRRGIDKIEKLEEFLNSKTYKGIEASDFPQMAEVIDMLTQAIDTRSSILVYGDYDVDGVASTAILVKTLNELGAKVSYHLPDRFKEGYGMNKGVIEKVAAEDIDLIISCDCGISNYNEVAFAKKLGMDVIITDHHEIPDRLPPADKILSPKLLETKDSAYNLPGAGMAYFLAKELLSKSSKIKDSEVLLEFLALAIVADVVPLQGENRYLLKKGLEALRTGKSIGIRELCKVSGIDPFDISETDIGFRLGPRINAAGRLDHAELGLELLLSQDQKEAKELAQRLNSINSKRQDLSSQMEKEGRKVLEGKEDISSIILYNKGWNQGIIGIGAGRLCEEFKVPAIFLTDKEGAEGVLVGSARSVPNLHIRDALKSCEDLLLGFGGHAGAAGLSLKKDNLEEFKVRLGEVLAEEMAYKGDLKIIQVDAKLPLSRLNLDLYYKLERLAPFGEGNPRPTFYSTGLKLISYRKIGEGKHLKLTLAGEEKSFSALWWGGDEDKLSDDMDLTYSLDINKWRGRVDLQLVIEGVIDRSIEEVRREKKVEISFEDFRNWRELGEELPSLTDALYYYEGTKDFNFSPIVNRYQNTKSKNLILLSPPPTLNILRDILKSIQPQRVLLAYSDLQLSSSKDFLKILIGIIKGIISKRKGMTTIEELSSLTGEDEGAILLALRYLQGEGLIQLDFIERRNLFIKKGRGKKKETTEYKVKLQSSLQESRAFKRYLLKNELEKIESLFKIDS